MAQFSAIQGAVMDDFNQDGKDEIFAAGNFYPFRVQLGREDAAMGLILQNDTKGNFITKGYASAGVIVDGDIRDMVAVKNKTGKKIIVVSKNNSSVQVLKLNK